MKSVISLFNVLGRYQSTDNQPARFCGQVMRYCLSQGLTANEIESVFHNFYNGAILNTIDWRFIREMLPELVGRLPYTPITFIDFYSLFRYMD